MRLLITHKSIFGHITPLRYISYCMNGNLFIEPDVHATCKRFLPQFTRLGHVEKEFSHNLQNLSSIVKICTG